MEEPAGSGRDAAPASLVSRAGLVSREIELIYAECLPKVVSFAARALGDAEAGRDIAQEAFAAALASAPSFRGDSELLTWILSIARKLCLKRLRGSRELSFGDIEAIVDGQAQPPAPGRSAVEIAYYAEEVKEGCLSGLLLCLPFAQRCAFILRLLIDLPLPTVARALGRSENSVRILLSRARSSMRTFLCSNCSRVSPGAKCACENMIEFSLRRDLVKAYRPVLGSGEIKAELRRFADEVELYRSLPDPGAAIALAIEGGAYRILAKK
jgi:RNA polymerase sigma-70 factor (ECF subfamily)